MISRFSLTLAAPATRKPPLLSAAALCCVPLFCTADRCRVPLITIVLLALLWLALVP